MEKTMVMESKTAVWPTEINEANKIYTEMLNEAGKAKTIKSLKDIEKAGFKVDKNPTNPNTGKNEMDGGIWIHLSDKKGDYVTFEKEVVKKFFGTGTEIELEKHKKGLLTPVKGFHELDTGLTKRKGAVAPLLFHPKWLK
jgi:hypothetical protein